MRGKVPQRQTVILLGASNLTLGWSALTASLQQTFSDPLTLFVALGMGRSYVANSRFAARELPGIQSCGIWAQLPAMASVPPVVMITDIGNDLVYGHELTTITEAVGCCVRKCRAAFSDCRIVMTLLPLQSIQQLGPARFAIFRRLLFPGLRLTLSEIQGRSVELNSQVMSLAEREGIPTVQPAADWFGMDPIHIRRNARQQAFASILSPLRNGEQPGGSGHRVARTWLPPCAATRVLWGRQRITSQPCYRSERLTVYAY